MSIRDSVRKLIEFNPSLTTSEIASTLGISRQLAHYHSHKLALPRRSPNRSCHWCKKRISRYNTSGLCREHRPIAFVYEFACAYCGEVHVVEGHDAAQRRQAMKSKKSGLDFCNNTCSGKYFFHRGDSLTNSE